MPVEILMPALSPTMKEGVLVKWCKNEGDSVKPGEAVAEIETDKATMEVEAAEGGTIGKIIVPAGSEKVPVNSVIGWILEKGEDKSVLDNLPSELNVEEPILKEACTPSDPINSLACMGIAVAPEPEKPSLHEPQTFSTRKFASPLAKRIASQRGIDIDSITGTGPLGRVIKSDVLAASNSSAPTKTRTAVSAPDTKIEITRLRRVIADKMEENKRTVPHFYLSVDYDMSKLMALRSDLNKAHEQNPQSSRKVSVTDLLIKSIAMALADLPDANVSWHGTHIMRHGSVDVAVAVSIDGGLVTPVVRQAEQKSVFAISADLEELAGRARSGKIKLDEISGGSFTISNLGMYNIDGFTAILNSPQSLIFAIGATKQMPVVRDGKIVVGHVMNITASCDHRAIDGMLAALVMNKIKDYIENPVRLLI